MSAQAADLIETNFVEFLLSMGRAGGAVERLDDEIAWTIGGSPIGYHNAVVRCTASEGRSRFLVEEWRDALRQSSLPGSWHWTPGMHPHDLPRLLLDAGFEDGGDEPAMAAQLAALADMPMATELQSRLSRTPLPSTSTARFSPLGSVRGPRRPTGSPASSPSSVSNHTVDGDTSSARWQTILSPPPPPC
jgi:hypothetical protein